MYIFSFKEIKKRVIQILGSFVLLYKVVDNIYNEFLLKFKKN